MEHNRGSPRLQFTKEELNDPTLGKYARKAEKAANACDKAEKKLRTKRRLKLAAIETEATSSNEAFNSGTIGAEMQTQAAGPSFERNIPFKDPVAPGV